MSDPKELQFNWRLPSEDVRSFQRICAAKGYLRKAQVVSMLRDWIVKEEGKRPAEEPKKNLPRDPALEEIMKKLLSGSAKSVRLLPPARVLTQEEIAELVKKGILGKRAHEEPRQGVG